MRTPDGKTIAFTFFSHPTKSLKMRWTMQIEFPPGIGADAMLRLEIKDGEETPVATGTMEFAGRMIKVKNGEAELAYSDFVKGKHDKGVWLHRRGMPPIPGGLTFA